MTVCNNEGMVINKSKLVLKKSYFLFLLKKQFKQKNNIFCSEKSCKYFFCRV